MSDKEKEEPKAVWPQSIEMRASMACNPLTIQLYIRGMNYMREGADGKVIGQRLIATGTLQEPVFINDKEGYSYPPSFTLHPHHAKQLMDDLWSAGFRPSQEEANKGHLQAVEHHLRDMRRLVFKGLQDGEVVIEWTDKRSPPKK